MKILSKIECDILQAFAETLLPLPSKKLTISIKEAKLIERIDDHLCYFAKDERLSFRIILFLFDYGALFYGLRFKPFRKLDAKWRWKYLEYWHNTRLAPKRGLWRFLEAIVYMNYYTIPEVAAQIGYTPKFQQPLPEPTFPKENAHLEPIDHDITDECDVCVIGSGAGGAAIAHTLAKQGRKVIILEEGGYYTAKYFGKDAVTMTKLLYRNGGIINTFGWPAILVPIGRCVGGTTTINSGTCFRTPPQVLNKWTHEFGLAGWTPEKMERHYESVEKILGVEKTKPEVLGQNTATVAKAVKAIGFTGEPVDRNVPHCKASGVCCFGCPTNAKQSCQLSYIPRALECGAKLYTHCQVSRFLFSGSHANKVIARFRHHETGERMGSLEVKAKVIVLAAGTLHTPGLLYRSNVPNRSGQIGHNLTLHPAAKVMAIFDDEIRGWAEVPQSFFCDSMVNEGIKFETVFLPPPYAASAILHTGEKHRDAMENYNNIATFGFLVSDSSKGRILTLPGGHPIAIYNVVKIDLPKYVKGIETLADMFFQAGAKSVLLPLHNIPELTREEGADVIAKRRIKSKDLDLQAFHPLGTCRMGADPKQAVCDQNGRFYGFDNVFIADGSIFPTSLGVNPMVTIMAAATKIGEFIDREVL